MNKPNLLQIVYPSLYDQDLGIEVIYLDHPIDHPKSLDLYYIWVLDGVWMQRLFLEPPGMYYKEMMRR